ncbi:efflux RND transporter permease subunit [Romboutsia sedimentorum]|uniref:efflux RND transporter permease subunit n=1 Tax=Romboutsia sedimentorum TaxID=1368474 RepID=UPI0024DEE36E|nr:efflux RND transporter permease subunit [Romboutsia sedimentorum]MDK2584508.1 efflux RND transporter permease subunit [Romboutsia sedimentorum]
MIPKFSVKRPFTVAVGVILVLILGFVSFKNMNTDLLPSVDLPYAMVTTVYPGANPEKVEYSVTKPLEQALATTSGLENISSTSSENSSTVMLKFNKNINMDSAMIDMSGKIDMVKGQFEDSVASPIIMKMNPDMMPIMMLSIDIEKMNIKEVTKYVNEKILPQFERIEGVASVTAMGLVEDQLKVTLDKEKIYKINQRVLSSVESEFNKQQKVLDKSKYDIKNSKSAIEKGSKELQKGKEQLQSAVDKIGMSRSEGTSLAKKGLEAIDGLETLKNKEKELSNASAKLKQGEEELNKAQVKMDDAKAKAYKSADIKDKINADMIGKILVAENFSMPAGYVKEGETQYTVKVGDKFKSAKELEDLLLFKDDKTIGSIKLKDVAKVEFTDNSDKTYTNINGNEGVMLTFQKSSNFSTSNVTKSINKTIKSLSNENKNIHITTLMDQGVYIDMIIASVLDNLIYGGILAIIVLLVFLRSFKTTLVVAFSIPISVLFAVVLMYFSNITLNIISLSGLALGVGMLVDNSIVVIENIYRLRNQGMSIKKAAVYGARQVSGAIFASTLTTICVFLPIVFTKGVTKQLFVDMGLTIAYSLIASLVVALTVVPAMSSSLLTSVYDKPHRLFDKFVDSYEFILRKSLDYKYIVITFSIVLLLFTGYKALGMGTKFMPSMDSTQMTASMKMPKNSEKSQITATSDEFVDKVLTIKEVETVGAIQGNMMGEKDGTSFYIILKEDKELTNNQVEDLIYKKTKGMNCEIKVSASTMDMNAIGGSGIEVVIKGNEFDKLQEISKEIAQILKKIEGTTDVSDGIKDSQGETRIIVDKNKAMEYGLTVAQVYQSVLESIQRDKTLSSVRIDENEYPLIVENETEVSKDNLLEQTIKANKDNEQIEVKLKSIAKLEFVQGLSSITRDNQSRYITARASVDSKHNVGLVSRDVEYALKDYKVPPGYSIEVKGENETINKSLKDLVFMGILAIIFVYLIMVAQFQSLLSPFIVMFTIPLAFTGGLLALIITNGEISVISMLGFLVLCGVIVNNGIVFVDYINQLRLEGKNKRDAIIETGRTRIRPILMTALTTILAMSTMALGVGMGSEMTQGLAVVTIGGLIYGTILTLVLIPVLYDLFHRREIKNTIIEDE